MVCYLCRCTLSLITTGAESSPRYHTSILVHVGTMITKVIQKYNVCCKYQYVRNFDQLKTFEREMRCWYTGLIYLFCCKYQCVRNFWLIVNLWTGNAMSVYCVNISFQHVFVISNYLSRPLDSSPNTKIDYQPYNKETND